MCLDHPAAAGRLLRWHGAARGATARAAPPLDTSPRVGRAVCATFFDSFCQDRGEPAVLSREAVHGRVARLAGQGLQIGRGGGDRGGEQRSVRRLLRLADLGVTNLVRVGVGVGVRVGVRVGARVRATVDPCSPELDMPELG